MFSLGLRRSRTLLGALAAGLLAASLLLMGLSPAAAHSGHYELQVTHDGAGGINVTGKYEADGHTVEAIMDPVATATTKDGRTAGPIKLVSSAEGQGIWVSPEPFLADGEWTVTVATTTPGEATASATFTVAPIAAPVAPEPLAGEGNVASASTPDAAPAWPLIAGGVLILALAIAGAFVFLHRRAGRLAAS